MNKSVEIGDRVKIVFLKKDYEGILLESPVNESNVLLLKLDSGYNIGFNRKEIGEIVLLKKRKEESVKVESIKSNSSKPNIGMIITGGTIASRLDSKTGGVDALVTPEDLFKFYPSLFEKVNVSRVEVPFMKSSEDMDFKDWQKIAKSAVTLLNDESIKGIIITHGTDILHYSSAALSFFLGKVNKPVVFTYAQRSIDRASSDAELNLKCSALVAISNIAEVMLVGHGSPNDDFCYAMPGTKVRKLHSSRRDAFKCVNSKPFAKIFANHIEILSEYSPRKNECVKLDALFEEKVALVKVYPGQNSNILDYYTKEGYKGIVLEILGLGHVPSKNSRNNWLASIKRAQEKGIIICSTAQTIFGRLDPLVYSNGRELLKTGVLFLGDMLSETAFVKLGWVLGHKEWAKNKGIVKEKMLCNFSNEISKRLEFSENFF